YATPARLKFLKTDRSEAEAVREVVRRLVMSRPDVSFTLAGEERAPMTWSAAADGDELARLGDVLGPDFRANAVAINAEREGVRVTGFAGLPTLSRANSLGQYLFVNGGQCATSFCSAPCAPLMPTICRAIVIQCWRCSCRSIRAR